MSNYELISTKEAAKRLGVSRQRVDQLIAKGSIEAIKIPIPGSNRHHVHIDAASVEARRREARAARMSTSVKSPTPIKPVVDKPVVDRPAASEPIIVADPPKRRRRRRMRKSPHGYLTVAQVAKRYNVVPGTVRRWVHDGSLKAYRWTDESGHQVGRKELMVIRESDLAEFKRPLPPHVAMHAAVKAARQSQVKPVKQVVEVAPQPSEPTRRGFWARLLGKS
jgi:excisionase family DNA binding protein